MKLRRGQADTLTLFVVTIVIVLILLIFVFSAAVIRTLDKSGSGLKVYSGDENGLGNMEGYSSEYAEIVKTRLFVAKGSSVSEAVGRAESEK